MAAFLSLSRVFLSSYKSEVSPRLCNRYRKRHPLLKDSKMAPTSRSRSQSEAKVLTFMTEGLHH